MNRVAVRALMALALLSLPLLAIAQPCAEPESAQFDFWVGRWEVYAQGKLAGHNTISRIHGGCTLLEEYSAAGSAYEGRSFNYYDPTDEQWQQAKKDTIGGLLKEDFRTLPGKMPMTADWLIALQIEADPGSRIITDDTGEEWRALRETRPPRALSWFAAIEWLESLDGEPRKPNGGTTIE